MGWFCVLTIIAVPSQALDSDDGDCVYEITCQEASQNIIFGDRTNIQTFLHITDFELQNSVTFLVYNI